MNRLALVAAVTAAVAACSSPEPQGLMATPEGTGATVRFDMFHRPLPEIPLPNDLATRFDPSSPTRRRINASMQAATEWEKATREEIDNLDGWGTYSPISIGFDKGLDLEEIYKRHVGDDYDPRNDAVYVIDITPDSPDFCEAVPLDMGEGNFPLVLERQSYYPNDSHNDNQQLVFEEVEEDKNGNNRLDLGEDLDMDGELDHPNYRHPDASPFDVLSFYERQTHTLIMRPVLPMRENTTYAAVITRRLLDEDGRPVRSPFAYINHAAQTKQLKTLTECLPKYGLGLDDVAFTWPFTTQSITRDFRAVRDGLYGYGPMQRLATEYPAELKNVWDLRSEGPNLKIIPGDDFAAVAEELMKSQNGGKIDAKSKVALEHMRFIDYHVVASFFSPQLFNREGPDGTPLPLYRQVWSLNPDTGVSITRPELVTVWITVPKNRTGPAPLAILGHGYTGNKLDPLFYGGLMARYGIATVGMEDVSHGIGLPAADAEIARSLFKGKGYEGFFNALLKDRALDQNRDGVKDSGADFWTSYAFHTRDVVRQSAVDYMQFIRILRSFDGATTWQFGPNKSGLAGDFDGDGKVDIGGSGSINITGGSLGGIMSVVLGGTEPAIDVAVPVSGGAGLSDIGVRSIQGGVAEAVNLRMFGPLLMSLKDESTGKLDLWQYLPDLNDLGKVKLAPIDVQLDEADTVIVRNLKTNDYRCGRVQAGGLFRVAVSSDGPAPVKPGDPMPLGDALVLEVYAGVLPPQTPEGCRKPEAATPKLVIDKLGYDAKFQGLEHAAGEALTALGDGFGIRRQHPELRRFMGLAQLVMEKGDPANYAPNFERRLLKYGTGEEVHTRALVLNTIGDMNVPMATGAAIARAAGFIELRTKDPRYGKTANRVLIDNGALTAVERTHQWQNSKGQDVLMDIDHLSEISGTDDQFDVPRLNPPLRLVGSSQRVGGKSGALFPMVVPTGRHGFDTPNPSQPFDLGSFMMNLVGRYISTQGRELPLEACMVNSSCDWIAPVPPKPVQ